MCSAKGQISLVSIGDCILYLNHPELSVLNEYQQNHRSFYEWIGKVNTFELEVPWFSTGRKELWQGRNHIFLTTDGLVECPNVNFVNPIEIFKPFERFTNEESVWTLLNEIKEKNVRDSTTILSWFVDIDKEGSQPSKWVKCSQEKRNFNRLARPYNRGRPKNIPLTLVVYNLLLDKSLNHNKNKELQKKKFIKENECVRNLIFYRWSSK